MKHYIKIIFGLIDILSHGLIKNQVTIGLVYHEVSDSPCQMSLDTGTYTLVSSFNKHMRWISKYYNVISGTTMIRRQNSSRRTNLVLTFDDGYKSFKTNIVPIISAFGFQTTCFINGETSKGGINSSALVSYLSKTKNEELDWKNSNPEYFRTRLAELSSDDVMDLKNYQGEFMSEKELIEISENELIELGNHLFNHWYCPSLTEQELVTAIHLNSIFLEKIGTFEKSLCWPHGVSLKEHSELSKKLGIKVQFYGSRSKNRGDEVINFCRADMNERNSNYFVFRGSLLLVRLRA